MGAHTQPWFCIVFMHDSEAREVIESLERFDGCVTFEGADEETISRAIKDLSADYDQGSESEHTPEDEDPRETNHRMVARGRYVLTWDIDLDFVGLYRQHQHTHHSTRTYTGANGHGFTVSTCWCGDTVTEDNGW